MHVQGMAQGTDGMGPQGLPFIDKCISMTPLGEHKDWFIIAEDSAKLFPTASIHAIQARLRNIPLGVEILQTGYRRTVRQTRMKLLDLDTMQFVKEEEEEENKVTKSLDKSYSSLPARVSSCSCTGFSRASKTTLTHPCANSLGQTWRSETTDRWQGAGHTTPWWMGANGRLKKCQSRDSWQKN